MMNSTDRCRSTGFTKCKGHRLSMMWAWIIVISTAFVNVDCSTEQSLMAQLLRDKTSTDIRPVRSHNTSVSVDLRLTILNIINVDERNQVMTTSTWLKTIWHDEYLQWNPLDYNNITTVRLHASKVWKPDIMLFNSADEGTLANYNDDIPVQVYSNGTIARTIPTVITSTCNLDMTMFPWDTQVCQLVFGSWTYTHKEITLTNKLGTADMKAYLNNSEWVLKATPYKHVMLSYATDDEFDELHYCLILQRKTLFYIFNLIIPGLCAVGLSLFVFCLPPTSGDKISLSITALLSMIFFLNMVADSTPIQSDVIPLLSQFFAVCLTCMTLSTICTVFLLRISDSSVADQPPPALVKKIAFGIIAKALCMSDVPKKPSKQRTNQKTKQLLMQNTDMDKNTQQNQHHLVNAQEDEAVPLQGLTKKLTESNDISDMLSRFDQKLRSQQEEEAISLEWFRLGMVLDRCCFVVYLVIIVISCLVLFTIPTTDVRC